MQFEIIRVIRVSKFFRQVKLILLHQLFFIVKLKAEPSGMKEIGFVQRECGFADGSDFKQEAAVIFEKLDPVLFLYRIGQVDKKHSHRGWCIRRRKEQIQASWEQWA